jgi:hypothetical protein
MRQTAFEQELRAQEAMRQAAILETKKKELEHT